MIQNFKIQSICWFSLFLLLAPNNGYGQIDELPQFKYELVDGPNGKIEKAVPLTSQAQKISEGLIAKSTISDMEASGVDEILNLLTSANHANLEEYELTSEQKPQLLAIRNEYIESLRAVNIFDVDSVNLVKAKYGKRIWKVLLPEQIKSIASRTIRRDKRLLSLLLYPDVSATLHLSADQKAKLASGSSTANVQIERSIAVVNRELDKCRKKILEVYDSVLDDEQKAKFEKLRKVEKHLKEMSLSDMDADTDKQLFKK